VGEEARTGAKVASGRRAKFPTVGFGENVAAMKRGSAPENTILKVKAKLGQAWLRGKLGVSLLFGPGSFSFSSGLICI
jgi:hypothetical protein